MFDAQSSFVELSSLCDKWAKNLLDFANNWHNLSKEDRLWQIALLVEFSEFINHYAQILLKMESAKD